MKYLLTVTLLFLVTRVHGAEHDARLIGLWKATHIIEDGRPRPYPNVGKLFFEYRSNGTLDIIGVVFGKTSRAPWTFSTDGKAQPSKLDRISADGDTKAVGIYRFPDKDTLEEIFGERSIRPVEFLTPRQDGVLILKRVSRIE